MDRFTFFIVATIAASVVGWIGAPPRASACSGSICPIVSALPQGGPTPPNAPALAVFVPPYWWSAAPPAVELVRLDSSGAESPVEGTFDGSLVMLADPLLPDSRYELRVVAPCGYDEGTTEYVHAVQTGATEVPLPTALGSLAVGEPFFGMVPVADIHGSCNVPIEAQVVDLEVELAGEAVAWEGLLVWTTRVDGAVWTHSNATITPGNPYDGVDEEPGGSWIGRGLDRLFVVCGEHESLRGLEPGTHVVRMEATVAGTSSVLTTQEITIELSCDGFVPGGERPATPGGEMAAASGTCSAVPGTPASGALGAVLVASVASLFARRRRC
jgi:hypothetical protein